MEITYDESEGGRITVFSDHRAIVISRGNDNDINPLEFAIKLKRVLEEYTGESIPLTYR